MSSNLYTAKSAQELESLSETHGIQVLAQLESKYSSRSPSEWGFPHLLALRALYSPDKPFLSELNSEHESNCPVCCEVSPQKVDYDSINSLIGNHPNLNNSSERELTRRPAGSFWLAMATIVARGTEGKREYPQRERKQVMRDGYVSTTASAFGSSPSNAGFGSSPTTASADFDIEMRELDDDEHDERRLQPEQLTVELFSSLVRYVLNYCLDQSDNIKEKKGKVRLRIERKTSTASVGDLSITAEDDGGICWMSQMVDGWHMSNANIALLEAKRAPTAIRYDERTQSYYPVVSNEHLAQYLGEAVVTWRANRDSIKDQVFLIAMTSTFMRIYHFRFGRHYESYLDASDEEEQKRVAYKTGNEAYAYIQSTSAFDLQRPQDRKVVLCHILAIVRWQMHHLHNA